MATADELLSTLDTDKTLIIDKDLRIITIPSSVKNLGVESDDDVLRLKFSMPRMYGDVDLSDFSIYINYMNAKNTGDVYVVDDKTIADDTITFSWLVGRVALAYKGNVRFIVCMKKHDGDSNVIQEYNTTIASLPVLEGLETGETVIQQNPDIIEMLLTSLEPLVGTTQTITPSQVLAAIKAGRDIALQYTDSYYGTFVFSAFNANEKLGIVVSNSILPQWDGLTGTLLGFVDDAGWVFKATNTATKDDVGTAVNEALAAAKASGEFDGADGITPTIGENGNWFLGNTDTNKPSRGKSAYSYAQDGGYTGTEAEFAAKLAAESIDKALYVVNLTTTDGVTFSADKTYNEIVQAYNEEKYNIVAITALGARAYIIPLLGVTAKTTVFSIILDGILYSFIITSNNEVKTGMLQFATKDDKLPNPYPLTFTGAVSGSYDGSSAKTIAIPSGGGSETIIAEETVLASGTIATETAANTFTASGITFGMLRNYRHWTVEFKSVNQSTYLAAGYKIGSNNCYICKLQHRNIKFQCEWLDKEKTIIRVFFVGGSGYGYGVSDISQSTNNSAQASMGKQDQYIIADVADDTMLGFFNYDALTNDILWRVKGVFKYGN